MKRMLLSILVTTVMIGGTFIGETAAQVNLPKVTLFIDKTTYNTGEPITAVITLKNFGGDIITSRGFKSMPFHLFLNFYDADNQLITSHLLKDSVGFDPPPPPQFICNGQIVPGEPVEIAESGWLWSVTIPNVHNYYTLTKYSQYSVRAKIPMRTYSTYCTDPGPPQTDFAPIDSQIWQGALESNIVNFTLLSPTTGSGTINVKAEKHTVGGGNSPGSTKESIGGLWIRVFDKASPCVARFGDSQHGFSWQNYGNIWTCASITSGETNIDDPGKGTISFQLPPGDYMLIALYDPDNNSQTDDSFYIGVSAEGLDPGETMNKYLQVIVKADGKKGPAKYTVKTGSELLIIEPEYIEWDGTQAFYPFVFESIGDWTVTTSVAPPEGFVADHNSLTAEVDTEIKAVQFVITDVGSKWEDTKVEHRIKHKGKTETIRSSVGIKLSKKLARQKGLGAFGDEDNRKK
jgi:hypothetical protein